MNDYELLKVEEKTFIKKTDDAGKVWIVPADPTNSDYAEYLRYTEWVEAGNNPEDFWSQDQDLAEPTKPTKKK